MRSFLSSLPVALNRILDTESDRLYNRNHQMYDVFALLTRYYTQHALRRLIDSETKHTRHFIR